MGENLGRELVKAGVLKEADLQEAEDCLKETGGSLARILVKLRLVKEPDLLEHVAKLEGLEVVKGEDVKLDEEILRKLPEDLVQRHQLVPVGHDNTYLKLALPDPSDLMAVEDVRFRTGLEVQVMLIAESDALRVLGEHYSKDLEKGVRPAPSKPHSRTGARKIVRELGQQVKASEAARVIGSLEASPAKLIRALATLLVDKGFVTADELKERLQVVE